jgi:Tfp pilus assembly protein PilF
MNQKPIELAWEYLRRRDYASAQATLQELIRREPRNAEAHRVLGMTYRLIGAPAQAEAAFKAAISADKREARHHAEYGSFLESQGRPKEAERAYRAGLSHNRRHAACAAGLANLLIGEGKIVEALQVTTPIASDPKAPGGAMRAHAAGLREMNRFAEAETILEDLVRAFPGNAQVHKDYAELVWMRTGEAEAAVAQIDKALAEQTNNPALHIVKATVLTQAGQPDAARAYLDEALAAAPDNANLQLARAQLGGQGQLERAEQALARDPDNVIILNILAQAQLEAGAPQAASETAARVLKVRPLDRLGTALQATAWRLLGDARYGELYDYDRTVRVTEIVPPKGWSSLSGYLADLAEGLNAMHTVKTHPFGQSVKGGSQVALIDPKHPAVAAFPKAIEPPIRETIAWLKAGGHPVGQEGRDNWRYTGMWSVKLRQAGYHDNHVHNAGWLSSACYVELPDLKGEEGWFKLGEPGLKLPEPLPPDRLIEPKPGRLVLFPSYVWHGTVPFTSEKPRLSVAFDLVPEGV